MQYLEELFLSYVGWEIEDSYSNINLTAQSILDFSIPQGTTLRISSNSTLNSFAEHTINNSGVLKGSIAYLYSSCPNTLETSRTIPLHKLVQCYRKEPLAQTTHNPGSFLYGRMYLPGQQTEAMYIQSLGTRNQLVSKWVVDPQLATPFILTTALQSTSASKTWTREFIYSTHENLMGFQFLANLCSWMEPEGTSTLVSGMELFYAASKKSPGMSAGVRYSTHSRYSAVPLTLSLVCNPLMGSVSAAYSLKPSLLSAVSTRFDFNCYSYMSNLTVGCELWRTSAISLRSTGSSNEREGSMSVIKASTSLATQSAQILWEGSFRDILVSSGLKVCYGDRRAPVSVGLEMVYSS